jgi:hypothetical protein
MLTKKYHGLYNYYVDPICQLLLQITVAKSRYSSGHLRQIDIEIPARLYVCRNCGMPSMAA